MNRMVLPIRQLRDIGPLPSRSGILSAIAAAVRDGGDVIHILRGLLVQVDRRTAHRLRSCIADLEGPQPRPLVDTLVAHRIIHGDAGGAARAAAEAGRLALERFLAALARDDEAVLDFGPAIRTTAVMVLAAALLAFYGIAIAPKLYAMFLDIGIPLPPRSAAVFGFCRLVVEWLWLWGIVVAAALIPALLLQARWRRHRVVRRARAMLLLSGVADGRDEPALAKALNSDPALDGAALSRAAATGDFSALCHVCGWRVATPAALAAATAADGRAAAVRRRVFTQVNEIALPLLIAVPVWWLATGFFTALIALLHALAEQTP